MSNYVSEWSLTRRKVFTNCARRFSIKYLTNNIQKTGEYSAPRWRSPYDVMIISTREVFFQWLKDLHNNVIWTGKTIYSNLRFKIITNLYKFNSQSTEGIKPDKDRLISNGYARLKTLLRQPLIRKLSSGEIREWSFHERTGVVTFGHLQVYCSPDIVFRTANKWHLVRLNFQSECKQPYLDLELCTMLLWSKGNQYMPNLESKFTIYGIFFIEGKWYQRRVIPSQRMLQETKQLLEKDVHHMNVLRDYFYRTSNIDTLPLTKSPMYCKRCPYKTNCPVFGDRQDDFNKP